eukprot:6561017-Pyramimonas_sp.AAC.1
MAKGHGQRMIVRRETRSEHNKSRSFVQVFVGTKGGSKFDPARRECVTIPSTNTRVDRRTGY